MQDIDCSGWWEDVVVVGGGGGGGGGGEFSPPQSANSLPLHRHPGRQAGARAGAAVKPPGRRAAERAGQGRAGQESSAKSGRLTKRLQMGGERPLFAVINFNINGLADYPPAHMGVCGVRSEESQGLSAALQVIARQASRQEARQRDERGEAQADERQAKRAGSTQPGGFVCWVQRGHRVQAVLGEGAMASAADAGRWTCTPASKPACQTDCAVASWSTAREGMEPKCRVQSVAKGSGGMRCSGAAAAASRARASNAQDARP